jgi:hypothetical protein
VALFVEMAPTLEMVDPKDGDGAKSAAAAAPDMSLNAEDADVDGAICVRGRGLPCTMV